jgi:hypothetical protein
MESKPFKTLYDFRNYPRIYYIVITMLLHSFLTQVIDNINLLKTINFVAFITDLRNKSFEEASSSR